MLRSNKYIIASLSLAVLLAACGGGGGGSGGNSSPDTNTPSIENIVSLVSSLASPSNTVTAGTSYSITATLSQGNSSTVNFANDTDTPNTVTYSPNSCALTSSNNKCTVKVNVGLATAATDGRAIYSTNVSYSNLDSTFVTQKISFAVAKPNLEIIYQPSTSIAVGKSTHITYTIPSEVVPTGSAGNIDLAFSSSNSSAIPAPSESCVISYSESGEITPCTVSITAINNASDVTITASDTAHHFADAISNAITTTGSPFAVDTLGFTNSFGVYAGQEFKIKVQSLAGATESVTFAGNEGTSSYVTISPPTCIVAPGSPCTATVKVALSTPPTGNLQSYGINIIHSTGTQNVAFGVQAPVLIVESAPNPSSIYVSGAPSASNVKYTIESTAVPAGTGSVNVTLSSSNTSAATVNSSCTISYTEGIATGCNSTINAATTGGGATIKAAATYFESANATINVLDPNAVFNVLQQKNTVYAGQSFNIQVTMSQNTTATVKFAPDNGSNNSNFSIQTDQQGNDLCTLNQVNNSCNAKVMVAVGTPASTYTIAITNTTTNETISKQEIKVVQPQLATNAVMNNYMIINNGYGSVGYTIPLDQIPTNGSGNITVNLAVSSNQQNNINITLPLNPTNTCTISYDRGVITNMYEANTCSQVYIRASKVGSAIITASSNSLVSTVVPVYVSQGITYALGNGPIITFGSLGYGLYQIPETLDGGSQLNTGISNPGNMAVRTLPNGKIVLYIPDQNNNTVNVYSTHRNNGKPDSLIGSVSIQDPSNTDVNYVASQPLVVTISPDGNYAYTINKGQSTASFSTISAFSINQSNGMLTFISASKLASSYANGTIGAESLSSGQYLYIGGMNLPTPSKSPYPYYILRYKISSNGKPSFQESMALSKGKVINSISASPNSKWLAVGEEEEGDGRNSQVFIYSTNNSNGTLGANPTHFPITLGTHFAVYFSTNNTLFFVAENNESGLMFTYPSSKWISNSINYGGATSRGSMAFNNDGSEAYNLLYNNSTSIQMNNVSTGGVYPLVPASLNTGINLLQLFSAPRY